MLGVRERTPIMDSQNYTWTPEVKVSCHDPVRMFLPCSVVKKGDLEAFINCSKPTITMPACIQISVEVGGVSDTLSKQFKATESPKQLRMKDAPGYELDGIPPSMFDENSDTSIT